VACLNSVDLIATPGRRHTRVFQATTGAALRIALADCLSTIGWTVERADNMGEVGYKATSAASPWCASGDADPDYVGKCRVWFRRDFGGSGMFAQLTGFYCMNAAETIVQSASNIHLQPNASNSVGNYAPYSYMFVGTPYDFKLFMLGVQHRVTAGTSNERTAVFCGVPQIPGFLQARGAWCQYGINELFYCVDSSAMRTGGTFCDNRYFYGAISSSAGGTKANPNSAGGNRFGWFMTYGVDGGDGSFQSLESGNWVYDAALSLANSVPEIWPSIIVWASDPAVTTVKRMKGFMWDTVIVNKAFPGDCLLRFDDKVFVNFNNNSVGSQFPFRPPAAILIRVA